MTEVIAPEVAEFEFSRFAEAMDLDVDTDDMDTEDLTQFSKVKKRLIAAICNGFLVINEEGEAVYTPQNSKSLYKEPITFHERTGASLMGMDTKKKGHDVTKTYSVMAEMCKVPMKVFAGLVGLDIKICEGLFLLLMD